MLLTALPSVPHPRNGSCRQGNFVARGYLFKRPFEVRDAGFLDSAMP